MSKKLFVIIFIYFIQILASSCDSCNCDNAKTFVRTYTELELKAWDTSGFKNEELSSTVNKSNFGLSVAVLSELNQIAQLQLHTNLNLHGFGFAAAYACSCVPDEYINAEPIKSIEITVTNIETLEVINVTDNFSTYGYDNEKISISAFFDTIADWHDAFQIDMTTSDNIPDVSIFTVKIILESGIELQKETQEINFE